MSKEMREQIDRLKNWKQFNESKFDDLHGDVHGSFDINDTNVDKIINHIQSLPNSYNLKTSFGDTFRLDDSGIDTALNNGMITHFYLSYFRKNKKRTKILPTPNLNNNLYEKLNDLIKQCDLYKQPEETRTNSLMSVSDIDKKGLNNRLFRAMCFQMMNILLYEDFFGVDFRYGDGHKIIQDLVLPTDEEEYYELFSKWNNRESEIRPMLFYADAIPVVSIIEKYSRVQDFSFKIFNRNVDQNGTLTHNDGNMKSADNKEQNYQFKTNINMKTKTSNRDYNTLTGNEIEWIWRNQP